MRRRFCGCIIVLQSAWLSLLTMVTTGEIIIVLDFISVLKYSIESRGQSIDTIIHSEGTVEVGWVMESCLLVENGSPHCRRGVSTAVLNQALKKEDLLGDAKWSGANFNNCNTYPTIISCSLAPSCEHPSRLIMLYHTNYANKEETKFKSAFTPYKFGVEMISNEHEFWLQLIQKKCNMGRILSFESTGLNPQVHQLWIPLLPSDLLLSDV